MSRFLHCDLSPFSDQILICQLMLQGLDVWLLIPDPCAQASEMLSPVWVTSMRCLPLVNSQPTPPPKFPAPFIWFTHLFSYLFVCSFNVYQLHIRLIPWYLYCVNKIGFSQVKSRVQGEHCRQREEHLLRMLDVTLGKGQLESLPL